MRSVYYQALRGVPVRVQYVGLLAGIQGSLCMHFVEIQTGYAVASQREEGSLSLASLLTLEGSLV